MRSQISNLSLEKLAKEIIFRAHQTNTIIALAESCTGGMIGAALTDIAGSSSIFDRGFITYSNEAKNEVLNVTQACLDSHGAVSKNTALAMVAGVFAAAPRATLALSVTGIAGPGGGSSEKPVGLVHFACQARHKLPLHVSHIFSGDRHNIRKESLKTALKMILAELNTKTT
mgnify:CR=1 FL=1